MVLVAASYILFEAFVKDSSNLTAQNVVVAKTDIPEGTVIHNAEEAQAYFTVKRISSDNLVEGVIVVNRTDLGDAGLLAKLQDKLGNQEVSQEDVKQLIGYKITRTYAPNEQVLAEYVSTDVVEFASDERLFAIETSYVNSVAAEINEGDYVDLWLISSKDDETISRKLIGPLKIYKIKTGDNVTITDTSSAIPSIVLFKLDEEKIEYISTLKNEGTVFFVKYGNKPTQKDIDAALENAKKAEEERAEKEAEENGVEVSSPIDESMNDTNNSNVEDTIVSDVQDDVNTNTQTTTNTNNSSETTQD